MRALGGAAGVVLVAAAVFLLWPVQLGGWTSYAIVDGASIESGHRSDDLLVTRVRGDNRTEWFAVTGVSQPLQWLSDPVSLGISVFVLALLILGAGREIQRRRRRGVDPAPAHPAAESEARHTFRDVRASGRGLLIAGCIASLVFALLASVAWTREASFERTVMGAYAHSGTFSYSGKASRSVAYPDGLVATGQPAFVRLVPGLDVAFDYRFTSEQTVNIRGGIALEAVVADGQGWTRTVPLASTAPFEGTMAHVEGRLGLRRVETMIKRLQEATGADITQATVAIVPRVTVVGYTGDETIDEDFAPALTFTFDTIALRLAGPKASGPTPDLEGARTSSSLVPRLEGSTTVTEAASLTLGRVSLDVERARSLGLLGLLVGLSCALAGGLLLVRREADSEGDQIEARYGSRIVRARATIPEGRWVTDLQDIESLVRVAASYDRVVLRVVEPDGSDAFLVDDGIAVYRYRPGSGGALGVPRAVSVHVPGP